MHLKTEAQLDKLHSERHGSVRELNQFNELLTCRICQGYMIDPTTVDACYHTYCRSCILKHLLRDVYCPQCKSSGGKHISEDNLRSDDTLRALIYKLVPGLYQRECKRLAEFREQHQELDADEELLRPQLEQQQEFFTPGEPISLSLEYHPAMLKNCGSSEKPPICYLQCPADLRVVHLKRFLCSKYDIDAENKHVEVEVTYEDEVLPPSFTLMDVGYCYQWKRHAPMAFRYRILLHERETTKNDENNLSKVKQDIELSSAAAAAAAAAAATAKSGKSVTFAVDVDVAVDTQRLPLHATSKARNKSAQKLAKSKRLAKRESDDAATAPSNFKSLRSNDMRYSDYGVAATSCTQPSAPLLRVKSEPEPEPEPDNLGAVPNLNIVVSIPQSQLSKSAGYGDEGGFELKTANKKSSPPQMALVRNLPKLKIELNSMKAKLTMTKSAEPRLEDTAAAQQPQIDLETYAKNIGLKPIEPAAAAAAASVPPQDVLKYSPNASPMSSSSSSTNGSSGTVDASTCTNASSNCSTSSHRKRKKKHSKEPKDANGKRKKLHAEISSQTDGKMKMKITTTHNHKAHKLDLKRSHSLAGGELVSLHQLKLEEQAPSLATSKEDALNRTLGEESRSINSLMPASCSSSSSASNSSSSASSSASFAAEKLPRSGKELNLPASPPLPPSLFKGCTPATPPATPTPTPAPAAPAKPKLAAPPKPAKPQLVSNHNNRKAPMLLTCATPTANATPHFAVPQPPQRQAPPLPPHHMQRYQSTPSSIASAANKPPKRSLSLDETQAQLLAKHPRLDYQQQQQQQQLQLGKYAARLKPSPACAPPMRVYGPELAKTSPMPLRCPASLSLSLPQPTVTLTPLARNSQVGQQVGQALHGLSYPYAESGLPQLEIARLSLGLGGAAASLMGPPASPAKQPAKRAAAHAVQSPPLSLPAMVKSPPLSVALSGQRGGNSSSMHNAVYRTSPPALINLRSPQHAFAAKANAGAAKAAENAKKTATVAGAAATTAATVAASSNQSKANGNAALDKSKTSLRDFRPPATTTTAATATTATGTTAAAAAAATAKDADILDLSAGTGRSSNSNSNSNSSSSKLATTGSSSNNKHNKLAPTTSALSCNNSSSSSNSLEAAVNKIKQNFGANSNSNNNNNSSSSSNNNNNAAAAATAASGDDLQNLHLLSESATAREKISIKCGNIYENKPKNALVRPQNASVRSIPNPSALAFRNQATPTTTAAAATTTTIAAAATTIAAGTTTAIAAAAAAAAKPLTVKAEEQPKLAAAATLLSPNSNNNNNNNNNSSSSNNNNTSCTASAAAAATSPRALKKPTTIDQVAANLNIRAEAKAAALAEEAPLVLGGSSSSSSSNGAATAAKTPELEKAASSAANVAKTDAKAPATATATATATAATATATAAVAATPTTLALPSLAMPSAASAASSDSMSKPPVQIAATDTLASVASSA